MIGYNGAWWGWDIKGTVDIRSNDTSPPQISGVSPSPTGGTAVVAWQTNEISDSKVSYGVTTAYGSVAYSAAPETSHGLRLTNIQSGVQYYFRVESKDLAGNVSSATGDFVAIGPGSNAVIVTYSPSPAAAAALPPDGPCALDIASSYFDAVKQQYVNVYTARYIWGATEAVATRPSNNVARLRGTIRLVMNPAYPKADYRQFWSSRLIVTSKFNSAPPILDTFISPGQIADGWRDFSVQQTLAGGVNTGRFTGEVLGQMTSSQCAQAYPSYFAAPFSDLSGAYSHYIDINRPEIPVYSSATPNPPFYLGRDASSLPIQNNGPYLSYALLTSGNTQGGGWDTDVVDCRRPAVWHTRMSRQSVIHDVRHDKVSIASWLHRLPAI